MIWAATDAKNRTPLLWVLPPGGGSTALPPVVFLRSRALFWDTAAAVERPNATSPFPIYASSQKKQGCVFMRGDPGGKLSVGKIPSATRIKRLLAR